MGSIVEIKVPVFLKIQENGHKRVIYVGNWYGEKNRDNRLVLWTRKIIDKRNFMPA